MRSQGYMIDASKFRHRGKFKVYSIGTTGMVAPKTLDSELSVWFAFFNSTGLREIGEASQVEIEHTESWQALVSEDTIVCRYIKPVHKAFNQKKEIILNWNDREFKLIKAVDLNGESIYSVFVIEDVL